MSNVFQVQLFGFEPFGEYNENPSRVICMRLNQNKIGHYGVESTVLPVDYSVVEDIIVDQLGRRHPTLALGIGLAAGRSVVCVEKVALNYRDPTLRDNRGAAPAAQLIDPEGPDAIKTNLDAESLVADLRRAGIPAKVSLSAGAYLCNNAMYVICREARRHGFLGGFVHVPCHEELVANLGRDTPSMNMATMVRAVELIIKSTLRTDLLETATKIP